MENQNVTPETPVEAQAPVTPETPMESQAQETVAPQPAMTQTQQPGVEPQVTPQPAMQQPMYAQQNMYANPAVPPAAPKKKGNGVVIGLVIAIVVLLLALGGVAAFAVYNMVANTPEARLAKGFSKWNNTEASNENSVSETLGWEKINQSMLQGATYKDMSFDMTFPILELPTIGLDIMDTCDYANQKDYSEWEISIANVELMEFAIAADSDKLYLSIPTLLEDTYSVEYENFTKNFNNSTWAQMLGLTMDESLELNPWVAVEEDSDAATPQFSEEFMADLEEKMAELAENMTIEETGTAIEVTRDGKIVKCDGIYVVVPEDDLNDIMDMIQEELRDGDFGEEIIAQLEASGVVDVQETWDMIVSLLDVRYTDDFQLVFYLDNKNNIVHMATPEIATMDNGVAVGLCLDFLGEMDPTDVVEGFVKVIVDETGNAVSFDFALETEVEDTKTTTTLDLTAIVEEVGVGTSEGTLEYNYKWDSEKCEFEMSANMEADGEELLAFDMEGSFDDIVKGESFVLNLGTLDMTVDGETLMKISGEMEVKQLEEEVEIPSESTDLLDMSESDINNMMMEIMENADNMSSALESISF